MRPTLNELNKILDEINAQLHNVRQDARGPWSTSELMEIRKAVMAKREQIILGQGVREESVVRTYGNSGIKKIAMSAKEADDIDTKRKREEEKRKEELDRLERQHTDALLELKSAERVLDRFKRYDRVYHNLLRFTPLVALLGLVGLFVGLNLAASIVALSVGAVAFVVASVAHSDWHDSNAVEMDRVYNDRAGSGKIVKTAYIDPQLNVELAQIKYASALRKWTEATGG